MAMKIVVVSTVKTWVSNSVMCDVIAQKQNYGYKKLCTKMAVVSTVKTWASTPQFS